MRGRNLVIVLVVVAIALGCFWWLQGTNGRGPGSGRAVSAGTLGQNRAAPSAGDVVSWDGSTIRGTMADRRVRDELRRRILETWAREGESELSTAARDGRLPPMPTGADGRIDPKYIQSVFRDDMSPMAIKCYEELLARSPDAGGRIELVLKIVGDDQLGGIVEEAEIDGGVAGAFGDAKMNECITQSLLSLSFRPPPKDGWITVVYPMEFRPGDD